MKIILLTGGLYSIPTMHYLAGQKILHTVVAPGVPDKNTMLIQLNAQHLQVPFRRFSKDELTTGFKDFLAEAEPDVVFVFGCGFKIPEELFAIPKFGFFNIHFSLLPAYRGPAPIFWQVKNGETTSGVTIHQVTDQFDEGPMLIQQETQLTPAESCGLFSARLSMETVGLIAKAIEKLNNTGVQMLLPQNKARATYCKRPAISDLQVNWEILSATEIERLVNATNPDYNGATASFRGQPFRILEVNMVNMPNPTPTAPGTIVHADVNYGVIVACRDYQYLRINIAHLSEGVFSGAKLATLGIRAGERFDAPSNLTGIAIKP